jgi:hypothetical protein
MTILEYALDLKMLQLESRTSNGLPVSRARPSSGPLSVSSNSIHHTLLENVYVGELRCWKGAILEAAGQSELVSDGWK